MHRQLWSSLFAILLLIPWAVANVEKTIFIAPDPMPIPRHHLTLSAPNIHSLAHNNTFLRTHIKAGPASASFSTGMATWLLLRDLNPGQRYEVRVCWAATVCVFLYALLTYVSPPFGFSGWNLDSNGVT